jgi:pimeloyl-ACP methyl ester carboxylesterase
MGFNVLLCDQRSHGRSEGRLITFGVKESRDVLSWIDFIEKHFEPKKIVLGGMSMGATTVLLSLKYKLSHRVKAAVVDCGFTSPADIIKKVGKQSFKINASFFIPFLNLACKLFGGFSITEDSTVDTVKNSNLPIMFIHGEDDGFVPCEMSKKAYSFANQNCKILLIKGANHGLSFSIDEDKVTNEIKEFLAKNI